MEANKKVWSFYDDAIVARFLDFLAEAGKTLEDEDADDMFDQFLAKEGDDSYTYWESYWDDLGGSDASST